jgi:hypothetical protein
MMGKTVRRYAHPFALVAIFSEKRTCEHLFL